MSLLDHNAPLSPSADLIAQQIKQQARATFHQLVQVFNSGAQTFWQNSAASPVEIAAALGTDAKEVFELHGKIGALLASVKPDSIAPGMSVVGPFQYNEDGTVVISQPSPPAA